MLPVTFRCICLDIKLYVDGIEIPLNDFVKKILSGTIVGAIESLRGIRENWKEMEIKITRSSNP